MANELPEGVRCVGGKWLARVAVDVGERVSFELPTCATREDAEARFAILVEIAAGMRVAGKLQVAESVLRLAASRSNEVELATVRRMVAALAPPAPAPKRRP
jgi:hypothetical protein